VIGRQIPSMPMRATVGLLGPLTNSGSIFSACRPGIATLCALGCALRRLRLAAIPQAVTAASTRLGFDAIGQTAKTAGIDELAALVIKICELFWVAPSLLVARSRYLFDRGSGGKRVSPIRRRAGPLSPRCVSATCAVRAATIGRFAIVTIPSARRNCCDRVATVAGMRSDAPQRRLCLLASHLILDSAERARRENVGSDDIG
jgi:hypothetical protein